METDCAMATETDGSLEIAEDDSMDPSYTLSMDPASLGLVMEEVHAGTEIPWEEEIGIITDEAICIENIFCRVCAEQAAELIPVFEEQGMELSLADKIRWHLPITISEDDKLPVKLCPACITRLNSCHDLANLCLESEAKLERLFNIDDATEFNESANEQKVTNSKSPSDHLIDGMKQFRKERMADNKYNNLSSGDNSNEDFETVYLEDAIDDDLKGQVLDVIIEPVGMESLPAGQWKTANLRVKMPKDFADCDTTLKSQIVGAIQDIMIEEDQSAKTKKNSSITRGNNKEWKCDICSHVAPRKSSLLVHQRRTHAKSFACSYCYKTFSNGVARRQHEVVHRPETIVDDDENSRQNDNAVPSFVCEICEVSFKRKKQLANHNLEHHTDVKQFKCSKCDKQYGSLTSLDIHHATHLSETAYLCDLCGKSFKHVSNLRSHKRSHLGDEKKNTQVCSVCSKGFRSRFHLKEHMNVHQNRTPYSCDICSKKFHKKIQLRQHGSVHLGLQPYKCNICGIRFNRRGNMTQHLKRHERQLKYTCKVCSAGFDRLGTLLQHRKAHTKDELDDAIYRQVAADDSVQEAYKCEICNKLLAKKETLMLHMRSHSGEKLFACEVCGKKLSNKGSLTYHMRSYHTGERPYSCQYCTDAFLTREACSVHERIHTGERPYFCTVCKMGFRCSSNLAQHVRVHTNVRNHQCEHCEKSFLRKGALTVHLRTHTGERPYICDQCGRGFTQKNDMLKHRRTHTLERPFPCNICGMMFSQKREVAKHHLIHMQQVEEQTEETVEPHTVVITTSDDQLIHSFSAEVIDGTQTLLNVFNQF